MQCLTMDTNVKNRVTSQYKGFSFNSMTHFNGKNLGVNESGLFDLSGDKDNGVNIDAEFELVTTDFGIQNDKRVRFMYFGFDGDGDLEIDVYVDKEFLRTIPVTVFAGKKRAKIPVGRDGKGRYFSFRVRNTSGCNFAMYSIQALSMVLHSGHL